MSNADHWLREIFPEPSHYNPVDQLAAEPYPITARCNGILPCSFVVQVGEREQREYASIGARQVFHVT